MSIATEAAEMLAEQIVTPQGVQKIAEKVGLGPIAKLVGGTAITTFVLEHSSDLLSSVFNGVKAVVLFPFNCFKKKAEVKQEKALKVQVEERLQAVEEQGEAEIASLNGRITTLTEASDSLSQQLARMEGRFTQLDERVSGLSEEEGPLRKTLPAEIATISKPSASPGVIGRISL